MGKTFREDIDEFDGEECEHGQSKKNKEKARALKRKRARKNKTDQHSCFEIDQDE